MSETETGPVAEGELIAAHACGFTELRLVLARFGIVTVAQARLFLAALEASPELCRAIEVDGDAVRALLARLPEPAAQAAVFVPPPEGALAPREVPLPDATAPEQEEG